MGIAILVIAGVCLVLGVLFGVALGWKWNLLRMLLTVALAGVLAIFTPGLTEKMTLAIAAAAGYKAPSMAALLTTVLEPLGAIAKSSAIASVGAGLLKSAMIPLVYVILFLPVYLVSWIIYAIVHAIASKNANEPTGLDRGIGALTGIVMGILVGALILSPFATLSGVMETVKKSSATAGLPESSAATVLSAGPRFALQREDADVFDLAGSLENLDLGGVELGKILTAYSDSPVSAVYKAVGAEKLMGFITERISTIRENGKEYSFVGVLTELLSKADTISSAVRAVQGGDVADALSAAADLVQVVKGLPCFNGDDIADIVNTAIEVAAENGDANMAAALSGVRFTDGDALSDDMDVIANILRKLGDMGILNGNGGFENIDKKDLDQVGSMVRSLKTLGTSVPLLVNSALVSTSNGELEPICRTDLPEDQAGAAARDVVDVLLTVLDNYGGNEQLTEDQADQLENSLRALEDNPLINKDNLKKAIEYYVNQYSE